MEEIYDDETMIDSEEDMDTLCDSFGVEDETDIEAIMNGSVGVEDF